VLERRTFGSLAALVSTRMEDEGFLVAFTERSGGTSEGPFESLNLGFKTNDDAAHVLSNRELVREGLGMRPFACVRQVHGARMIRIGSGRAGRGFDGPPGLVGDADALWTTARGVSMAVLTADCVPIALADPGRGVLAVVHAGWRGVAAGIVDRAVELLAGANRVLAAVGPAIGRDHYEVGEDVLAAVSAASPAGAPAERCGDRFLLDLPGTVARILEAAGVRDLEIAGECTACEPSRFFSHRRDGESGRQALVAERLGR
jgi:YfiH family protein